VANLAGDSHPDLITANRFGNDVSVLHGNGDGSFQAPLSFGAGTAPYSVAVADLDGDGIPDLVTANVTSDDVSVLLATAPLPVPSLIGFSIGILSSLLALAGSRRLEPGNAASPPRAGLDIA